MKFTALGMGLMLLSVSFVASAESQDAKGVAILKGFEGSTLEGTVRFTEKDGGLAVSAEVRNAPPGSHGFHVHEFGGCSDQGKAAGSHYNPAGVSHGDAVRDGLTKAHAGDLGNLEVGPDGTGTLEAFLPGVRLAGAEYTIGGRAVILHEKQDDFGQPTGNAGGRIGCGAVLLTSS